MAYPTQSEIEIPLLTVLKQSGGSAKPRDIYGKVAAFFPDLTLAEQEQRMENASAGRKWWNLVQWARQNLVEIGDIDGTTRGVWTLTVKGSARLTVPSTNVLPPKDLSATPQVTLRDLVNKTREEAESRLLTELKELTPRGFEHFCRVFLQQLGFELEVTKESGDGGIDGHGQFRQGAVSLKSAFQAKRWLDAPVGRPEIDKFRGAIQGEYDHGVFLTTSRFTREAEDASHKKGAISILLLDGNAIVDLMLERGFGVVKQPIFLYEVSKDFFQFDAENE